MSVRFLKSIAKSAPAVHPTDATGLTPRFGSPGPLVLDRALKSLSNRVALLIREPVDFRLGFFDHLEQVRGIFLPPSPAR